MTFNEWRDGLIADIGVFENSYKREQVRNPSKYPDELDPYEWDDAFITFAQGMDLDYFNQE